MKTSISNKTSKNCFAVLLENNKTNESDENNKIDEIPISSLQKLEETNEVPSTMHQLQKSSTLHIIKLPFRHFEEMLLSPSQQPTGDTKYLLTFAYFFIKLRKFGLGKSLFS